ncbi:MAG TPA: hypothetical protein VGA13_04370 [Acidimicrobiales bacterium]
MRWLARLASLLCLVGAAAMAVPVGANAESPDSSGYWNRLKPKPPEEAPSVGNPIPPPPDVPQESLLVSHSGAEPQAISALRFAASQAVDATLILHRDDSEDAEVPFSTGQLDVPILACAIASSWDGEVDGAWENRPLWNPDACTSGVANAADDTMSWPIDERHFRNNPVVDSIEMALIPDGNQPFRIVFDKPTSDALRANDGSPLVEVSAFEFEPLPAAPPPGSASGPSTAPATPSPTFAATPPSPQLDTAPLTPAPAAGPALDTAAPVPPAETSAPVLVAADQPRADSESERLLATVILAVMGVSLAFATTGSAPEPRLIGGLARRG